MPKWLARALSRPELLCLIAASALTHFWRLFSPRAVVFDEFHFERFASAYLTGRFYFDVHPPLGNLMYAAAATLARIPADVLARPDPAPLLRILPAVFGTIVIPLVYTILRQLGSSRPVAALGALAILADNALLVTSRFVLLDIFLIGFGLAAAALYLAARSRIRAARWRFLVLAAALAGCALSVKWTGASALGLILGAWLLESVRRRIPLSRFVGEAALLVGIPILVYVSAFAVHFALLTRSGPGNTFMSAAFQSQLIGSLQYDSTVHVTFWQKLADVHRAMWYGNTSLQLVKHPASSPWYTWPLMKHPFSLWNGPVGADESRASIAFVGNPAVWWGGLLATLIGVVALLSRRARLRRVTAAGSAGTGFETSKPASAPAGFAVFFLLAGILINFVPFAAIQRVMYLYHYLLALVFVMMFGAYAAGMLARWNGASASRHAHPAWSRALYWAVVIVLLAGFVYVFPFTYGWPLSRSQWVARSWLLHPF
ncbi:MAG TPA: phospholipid carrier-dependent glycosyltransferase [Gemmatimonadaceae bacterium]|nr:phospholipid carrier-dependent glycosyltransferase [Gemmatimonadaceae bacterium]